MSDFVMKHMDNVRIDELKLVLPTDKYQWLFDIECLIGILSTITDDSISQEEKNIEISNRVQTVVDRYTNDKPQGVDLSFL